MARQLSFDLPVRQALGQEDFFVSPANAAAVAMVEGWTAWPGRKLLLLGETGAGKTHLTHVWANLSGGAIIDASDLTGADIETLANANLAVENIDRIAGSDEVETALFHLHNLILAQGHFLLMTGRNEAHLWPLTLPDLASRIQGTPAVALTAPDDALLTAVLMKLMADRQLVPKPNVIPYLVRHLERSFAAAQDIVVRLDEAALAEAIQINRDLARKLLDKRQR